MIMAGSVYIVHPSRSDTFRIWGLGDIHYGNRGAAIDLFKEDVRKIRDDPYSFWVGMGDYADCISVDNKNFDPAVLDGIDLKEVGEIGVAQLGKVAEILKPIADKCIGLCFGNHEDKLMRTHYQQQLHGWFCTQLGTIDLSYSAIFNLVFVRKKCDKPRMYRTKMFKSDSRAFSFFVTHGAGSANTAGGKINRLDKYLTSFNVRIVMSGHVHDQLAYPSVVLCPDQTFTRLTEEKRLGLFTGTYLRTYARGVCGYGDKRGYRPVPLGARWVTIIPSKNEVCAEV